MVSVLEFVLIFALQSVVSASIFALILSQIGGAA